MPTPDPPTTSPTSNQVEVADKHVSGSGSGKSLHVSVADWREGHAGETLSFQLFEPAVFQRLEKGDTVIVVAGPGLFGWWLREVVPVSRPTRR